MAPQLFKPTASDTNPPLPHDPLSAWENEPVISSKSQPVRDVGWVLRGAFVMVVFSVAGVLLAQLLMLTVAEQHLIQAAQAGAREAAFPRATVASVTDVVTQRWRNWSHNDLQYDSKLRVAIRSQNRVLRGLLPEELRGSICVEVAVPASVVLPRWIQPRNFIWGPQLLHATANG